MYAHLKNVTRTLFLAAPQDTTGLPGPTWGRRGTQGWKTGKGYDCGRENESSPGRACSCYLPVTAMIVRMRIFTPASGADAEFLFL
jgi:hypothetical protein